MLFGKAAGEEKELLNQAENYSNGWEFGSDDLQGDSSF